MGIRDVNLDICATIPRPDPSVKCSAGPEMSLSETNERESVDLVQRFTDALDADDYDTASACLEEYATYDDRKEYYRPQGDLAVVRLRPNGDAAISMAFDFFTQSTNRNLLQYALSTSSRMAARNLW